MVIERWLRPSVVVVALVAGMAGAGIHVAAEADEATPATHGALPGVSSEVLVKAGPVAVPDPTMALARVMIAPNSRIPEHEHTGTQIATIAAGELTYTVHTGSVTLYRFGSTADAPESIEAGETVVLGAGDALVEAPRSYHEAHNRGDEVVLIYLSVLYPSDEAPTVYQADAATPVP